MSKEKLIEARTRLAVQLYAIDREIQIRRFDDYKAKRPKASISELDLVEEKSKRRFGGRRQKKVSRSEEKVAKAALSAFASLSAEEKARISEELRKINEKQTKRAL